MPQLTGSADWGGRLARFAPTMSESARFAAAWTTSSLRSAKRVVKLDGEWHIAELDPREDGLRLPSMARCR